MSSIFISPSIFTILISSSFLSKFKLFVSDILFIFKEFILSGSVFSVVFILNSFTFSIFFDGLKVIPSSEFFFFLLGFSNRSNPNCISFLSKLDKLGGLASVLLIVSNFIESILIGSASFSFVNDNVSLLSTFDISIFNVLISSSCSRFMLSIIFIFIYFFKKTNAINL